MKKLLLLIISIALMGCAHFQDELSSNRIDYANKYKEDIISKSCANGDIYCEYHLRLIGFIQNPYRSEFYKNNHYNTLVYEVPNEIESKLLKVLKNKGLYLNYFKYIYNDQGDLYVVVYGSPKPSSRKDWAELKNHHDILKLKELKTKYPSITNEVPKCTCRYCTSGLDPKYWR